MTDWLYLASDANERATLADTLAAAMGRNVIWRATRNKIGALIPNVRHLKPGDTLLLAFRQPVMRAYLRARIGRPSKSADGTTAIDVVGAPYSDELQKAGYPVENGIAEVIHLEDLEECCFDLVGEYLPNQQALWSMDHEPRDQAAALQGGELRLPQMSARRSPDSGRQANSRVADKVATSDRSGPRIVPDAAAETRCFDVYVMVDWSASRSPSAARAANSVWFGTGEWRDDRFNLGTSLHHKTRSSARAWLATQVAKWIGEKRRVLIGLDFAFGYPKGFAAALGNANGGWSEVHRHLLNVHDNSQNEHDGARFAADCNDQLAPKGPGPFWGCHAGDVVLGQLTQRRVGVFTFPYGPEGLDEWRIVERHARRLAVPQSVWKLNCGVSVGMQTIVGIKHLTELRSSLEGMARIWPFETGFTSPVGSEVWLAEIFPSIVATDASVSNEEPRDKRQVVSCVLEAALRDATGAMRATLGRPSALSEAELETVLQEEGWMLFL